MECIIEILSSLRKSRLLEVSKDIKYRVATDQYKKRQGSELISEEPIRDALKVSVTALIDTSNELMEYLDSTSQKDMTFHYINTKYLQTIDKTIQSIRGYLDPRRQMKSEKS